MSHDLYDLDQKNRIQALNCEQSFIVEAPAGSGKTELLIQRFLALLSKVNKPEEILAITFTKKAANEMRLRIIRALQEATGEEPEQPHKKITYQLAKQVLACDARYNWGIRDNPNQLRIQTIDALCTYLTKQLPLLSQFGATPQINNNPIFLYQKAVQEVLSHVETDYEWSQAVATLLSHLDNDINKLEKLLIHLLSKRDQWLPYLPLTNHQDNLRHKLEENLQYVIDDQLQLFQKTFHASILSEMIEIARYAAENINDTSSAIYQWRDLTALPKQSPGLTAYVALAKLFLTKNLTLRKKVDTKLGFPSPANFKHIDEKNYHKKFRQKFALVLEKLTEEQELQEILAEILLLPQPFYTEQQWQILSSLLTILKITLAQVRVVFQQHGQIDFIENAQAALQALGSDDAPTDLALALDYQINHILIDEFQDTSHTQFHLLEKLIAGWQLHDGRTLFVVGDPMQSIYRFREAEVGLFIRMMQIGINDLYLIPLSLSINFRSMPGIVNWNNTFFKKIFPAFNEIGTGAVSYKMSASSASGDDKTTVAIQGFDTTEEKYQTEYIVTLIEKLLKESSDESIAILVRSRSHLINLLPALKKAKIDYQAMEIDALSSQQCIQDLLALTCALLHPSDRIAWLAILRAPWCGLSLNDLFIIANQAPHISIFEQLTRVDALQLSADGLQRIKRILPILQHQLTERYRSDIRTWIETTWLKLAGPATLLSEEAKDDVSVYFSLLGTFTTSELHLNLAFLKEQVNLLYAQPRPKNAIRLHIMTIHSAKGLEFDHVILPHLEKKNPYDSKSLLNWLEWPLVNGQNALMLTGIPDLESKEDDQLYCYIQRQQQIKLAYETDRLFYVATTRAKQSLFLTFNISSKDKSQYKVDSGSFLGKIWPHIRHKSDTIITQPDTDTTLSEKPTQIRKLLRLAATWQSPIPLKIATLASSHQSHQGFLMRNKKSAITGVVIHQLLQQLAIQSLSWWHNHTLNQKTEYIDRAFKSLGLDKAELAEARNFVVRVVDQVLADPRGQWLLQPYETHQAEYALTAIIDNEIKNIIIDRTFIDKGIRWIIDYKTTTFTQGELEDFLAKAYQKHEAQMLSYARAFQLLDETPIKLGLYFPAIPAWREWEPCSG